MISLSTCTTVPAMWSRHIAVSFLRTYKGCRHAPRMFIIDRHFLYSFFLILEFLLWTSCPWPNHCCITQVTHGEQKQKTHSRLSPSSSGASFPWPEWPTSTPAVTLMALAQLSHLPFSLWLNTHYNGIVCGEKWLDKTVPGKKCLDEMEERNRNVMNWHNPSHVLQTVPLSLLLAHGQAQTKSESVYPFPRNSIVPTSQRWRENNCLKRISCNWNVGQSSCHDSCLGNC